MHKVSRKDLNSAELEAVRVSKWLTTVVTANGEVLTKVEARVHVKELDLFVTVMLLEDTQAVLSLKKTLRRSRVSLPLDQRSETTSHQTWQKDRMQHGELRTIRCPLSTSSSSSSSAGSVRKLVAWTSRTKNPNTNDDNEEVRGNSSHDLPEWPEEFRHNLVDESVPEHRDASNSSHELPSEPRAKVVSGKHSIFTHFPKDRNCDICLRNKIKRVPCRRRTGTVAPRAENVGDLNNSGSQCSQ